MSRLRLQTKFLLSMLLISAGLTCTSLLLVRRSVHKQVKKEIFADLQNSVSTFQNFQRERELSLSRSAELLADLPTLRALMTTQHAATIQDASAEQWRLAGSDIFVLADRAGRVAALHTTSQGCTGEMAQASLNTSFSQAAASHWWYGAQHLYEVCLEPIYFGPATENRLLGFLAIGYEIDDRVASQVSRIAASQVAFYYGDDIVRSTLAPEQESELARHSALRSTPGVSQPLEMQLGDESFLSTQQKLLDAERLASIGRMASSISHDLRHSLAAIVANAEFLCESRLSSDQREELYGEVRIAVNQMTDLIDSLLEFSRTRESLRPSYGSVRDSVEHVVQAIRSHPEFHRVQIAISEQGNSIGWFDPKRLERALYNLLLNACEAVASNAGSILVELREIRDGAEIRVSDNGHGIPESIRGKLFEPFISQGKENGTGLGLTVVQKIVQDHGGDVIVEKTSREGTVFRVMLPLASASEVSPDDRVGRRPGPPLLARTKRAQSE